MAQTDSSGFLSFVADSIKKEGIEIFECMQASGISTGILTEKLSLEGIFGSVTYKKENSVCTIFLMGNKKKPSIKYSFRFDLPINTENFIIDGEPRLLTEEEEAFSKMRRRIEKEAKKRKSFFPNYSGIVLNPVYLMRNGETLVFLVSTTHNKEFIPFGNDYKFTFNEKSRLISREKIHQNLIEVTTGGTDTLQTGNALASYHTHSSFSSPFISSTDICTLLLTKDVVRWESHVVMSENYVSFFFPEAKILQIISREEFEKMSNEGVGE